jgi:hypothetical protein
MSGCGPIRMISQVLLLWPLLQAPVQPVVDSYVPGDKAEDSALAEVLQGYLSGHASAGHVYYYNRVDLDGDGRDEVIACLAGPYAGGTDGCTLFVFRINSNGYETLSEITGSEAPVIVSSGKTIGWSDLLVRRRGPSRTDGGWDGHYVRLAFNGRTYPSSTSGGDRLKDRVSGTAYMSDYSGSRGGHRLILEAAVTASHP